MSTAFDVLIQDCAKGLSGGKEPAVSASTAEGNTTTIIDGDLVDTRADASLARFEDCWIRTSFGTPSVEYIRKVMSFTPTSGTITVNRIWTGATKHPDATAYEVHYNMHPTPLKACINKALRTMRHQVYYPLGLLTNPDMEDATITDVWLEKASDKPANAAGTTAANIYRGKQSLEVTDSGIGDEYAYQAANAIGGKPMFVFGFGKTSAAATEAQLIAYDATNSAAIDTLDFDDLDWQEVSASITIPATCKSLQVRLNVVTASGVVYWDDVQCYYTDQREFTLPSWITAESQIGDVYYLPQGSAGPDEGYMVHQTQLRYLDTPKILGSSGRYKIQFSGASIGRPLYLACTRAYEELTLDADTTTADRDTVVEGALHYAFKQKGSDFEEEAAKHGDNWVALRREPDYGVKWGSAYEP